MKPNTILAHKLSISFHPDDNDKLSYREAYEIAKEFAKKFMYDKGFEVLFAVHTDREHIHAHFLISNCNFDTGKSYRRNQRDLYEMSEFFGFSVDSTNVATQITAVKAVVDEYKAGLSSGSMTDDVRGKVDEMVQKMYDAGLQDILDEYQSQLDAWLATK